MYQNPNDFGNRVKVVHYQESQVTCCCCLSVPTALTVLSILYMLLLPVFIHEVVSINQLGHDGVSTKFNFTSLASAVNWMSIVMLWFNMMKAYYLDDSVLRRDYFLRAAKNVVTFGVTSVLINILSFDDQRRKINDPGLIALILPIWLLSSASRYKQEKVKQE